MAAQDTIGHPLSFHAQEVGLLHGLEAEVVIAKVSFVVNGLRPAAMGDVCNSWLSERYVESSRRQKRRGDPRPPGLVRSGSEAGLTPFQSM